jgi:hypothetical protein
VSKRADFSHRLLERTAAIGLLLAFAPLSACATPSVPDGSLTVVTGQETDAWTQTPLPQSVLVELVGKMRTSLATVPAPATTVALGAGSPAESPAHFEVTAFDADNNAVLHGASIRFLIDGFAGATPTVFVGRTGGLGRAPGDLVFEHRHPIVEVVSHAFVFIAGGDVGSANQASVDIYDTANWVAAPQQPSLPSVPKSWAVAGSQLLLINDSGASWLDLNTGDTSAVTGPAGLQYSDIVGGITLVGANDTRYIVGGTRATGSASASVLRVASDGTLRALTLTSRRLGAAAAVVDGQLVVVGGSDTGAGVEVLNADETAFVALAYPADVTQGAALTALTSTSALVVGGLEPTTGTNAGLRTLDMTCTDSCALAPLSKLDFPFTQPTAFRLDDNQALISGESADGETHLFTLSTTSDFALSEQPLRTPRRGASVAVFPNGQVGVFGGNALADGSPATSIELYFPTL